MTVSVKTIQLATYKRDSKLLALASIPLSSKLRSARYYYDTMPAILHVFICIYGRSTKCITLSSAARRTPARRAAAQTPGSAVGLTRPTPVYGVYGSCTCSAYSIQY
eukprot:6197108-Pleurochrysis_carterae.AAC.3